ncbi:type II toxin-antitoxin system Phd/YefM family antitoxin [Paracraurococcus lichenis]|uniref:Antitoxin n=1 Tax=Paracraurococcus lichenis TaxID=3064888 RepID=A0ABT9DTX8_9PROT|nr:type II toxin-antitoxin system Phd/YefM family antitoxin [Paracraurococcus sp. LOR1-02]MDO9707357.1 type II toxin-antitoxin system Phd/YefM family antitoxin [Paracraurococcus sp. LOR1-02]
MDGHNPAPGTWKLQDAKARFSALVREAQRHGPQRVTVHGRDAVVVLSAEDYARLTTPRRSLFELMQTSPLRDLDIEFGEPGPRLPVRDAEL